jgi:urea transport system substrate-binding protein
MSIDSPENELFKKQWAEFSQARMLAGAENPLTTDPLEATHLGIRLWKQAVEKAGSFAPEVVAEAMSGLSITGASVITLRMDEENHHLHRPLFIGKIREDGQFEVVWQSSGLLAPQPMNPHFASE